MYFRLFLVPGLFALFLAVVGYFFPYVLPGNNASLIALVLLTMGLVGWRAAYGWLVQQRFMQEKVYILGTGERAQRLVLGLRQRKELGIDVIGWSGNVEGALTRESVAAHLMEMAAAHHVHRVIVAMPDRRGTFPVQELLQLRLNGARIEEATSWLEKISGRIEVEQLYPSWLIFADGFRFSTSFNLMRRVLSTLMAFILLIVVLPLLPFVILAIKLDSKGPVLYRQKRVGRAGHNFYCYKFRTMRQDAEADTGPTWADDDDPRITRVGKFLRMARIDEIPQLWCVFKGDMAFVGPRPERPEFVEWLSKEIPYYGVRHAVRPGITGWAQVRYKYGNTVEDAKEKLQYDLFYIKNASLGLDILIMFQTIKIVLLGRGAQ
jgi:sugar transferase (PEP-CTERM system associated)